MKGLSERLKDLEKDLNLTRGWQAELARACGIKPPSVNGWYSGSSRGIDAAHIFKAATFFKVHPKWLALGVGPKWLNESGEKGPHEPAVQATTFLSQELPDLKGLGPDELRALLVKHTTFVQKLARALASSSKEGSGYEMSQPTISSEASQTTLVTRKLGRTKRRGESDRAVQPAAKRAKGVG